MQGGKFDIDSEDGPNNQTEGTPEAAVRPPGDPKGLVRDDDAVIRIPGPG